MKINLIILILHATWLSAAAIIGSPFTDKELYLIEYEDGRVLDEHGGGNPKAYPSNDGLYQLWRLIYAEDGYFFIKNVRSGYFLDSNQNGDVYTIQLNGGNYQKWRLQAIHAYFHIINAQTGRYLDTSGDDTETDESSWSFFSDSQWRFIKRTPPGGLTCPQMNDYIGNDDGVLVEGAIFSSSCWNINYKKVADHDVKIQADCRARDGSTRHSQIHYDAFEECL